MKINRFAIITAIAMLIPFFGSGVNAVIYSIETYEASIKAGRFILDNGVRVEYARKIAFLRGIRNLLDFESWKRIKIGMRENIGKEADIISSELNVLLKDVEAILPELKLVFGVSHLHKEIIINLDNIQTAYANLSISYRYMR